MTNDGQELVYVGFCRICGTGPLGLRECGGCGEILVMCDECDAVWTDGNFSAQPLLAGEAGALPCPYCGTSLMEKPSQWASRSKIEKVAWLHDALRKGELKLGRGSPLKPEAKD